MTNALALVTSAKPQEEDGLLRNLDELDDSAIREVVASEFKCMICLQVMKKTMTVKECLHRFCNDCIQVKFAFPRLSLSLSLLICLFFTDWIFYPILFCFFLFFIVGVPPSQQVLPSVQSAPSVSSVSSRGSSFRRLNSECIPFVFFSFRCFLLPFGCPPSLLLFEYKELQVPTPTFHFFSLTNSFSPFFSPFHLCVCEFQGSVARRS